MKYRKILVPTDFSDGSENSLRFACNFAKRTESELIFLHVLDLPIYYYRTLETQIDDADELQKHALGQARDKMQQIVDHLPDAKGLKIHIRARAGGAAKEIVAEVSEEHDVDLVVIATHGRGGFAHALMGSVAEKVIRSCTVPVITIKESYTDHAKLIGEGGDGKLRGIVFSSDLSESAVTALEPAGDLARTFHAPLYVIHVLEDLAAYPLVNWSYFPDVETTQFYSQAEKNAEVELEKMVDKHCPPATVDTKIVIRRGQVAAEIVEEAKNRQSDLIVMATHGRTGWQHAIIGSVAEKVARIAECPVLTVRAREDDAKK